MLVVHLRCVWTSQTTRFNLVVARRLTAIFLQNAFVHLAEIPIVKRVFVVVAHPLVTGARVPEQGFASLKFRPVRALGAARPLDVCIGFIQ